MQDFQGANLQYMDLAGADLRYANLENTNLRDTDLAWAMFIGNPAMCIGNPNLWKRLPSAATRSKRGPVGGNTAITTDFRGADLSGANLNGAVLYGSDLTRANLSFSKLHGTNFSGARMGLTLLAHVNLQQSVGLTEVRHHAPSMIGIDTLYQSKGEIPEIFLRGAGVPDQFITFARSLVGQAIEFYSCFISYSTTDQDFADRLYADLQSKRVRCFLATEDLKIGDKFRSRIEESIRMHDKLLLVLSKASLASPWVEDEVESALERERRESRLVLFPVRVDGAVMKTDVPWAVHLRQKRHIGNFTGWKAHAPYQKAFQRLLRDLKTEAGKEAQSKDGR